MSEVMHREFTLSSPQVWQAACAFVKANAKAAIDANEPLRLILTTAEQKRRAEQNAFYWSAVIAAIADQAWVNRRKFDKDVWHEHVAGMFCPKVECTNPITGEVFSRRKSTTEMGVKEFARYVEQVQAYAASELGVVFEG